MFSDLLHADRDRADLTIDQAARRVGIPVVAYRKLEAGERWPTWETFRIRPVRLAAVAPIVGDRRHLDQGVLDV